MSPRPEAKKFFEEAEEEKKSDADEEEIKTQLSETDEAYRTRIKHLVKGTYLDDIKTDSGKKINIRSLVEIISRLYQDPNQLPKNI
jgi:hypothetical protein